MSLTPPPRDLEQRFGVEPSSDYAPRYNIAPQDDRDVIPEADAEEVAQFNLGLRPHWVDDPNDWGHPINTRAETVAEKRSFRD